MINCTPFIYTISDDQLKKKFKHASDFGIEGVCNIQNLKKFKKAIKVHLESSTTKEIKGTYRKKSVVHYLNLETALNVFFNDRGDFVSGWKLNENQFQMIIKTGNIGGS